MPLLIEAVAALNSLAWTAPQVIDTREGQRLVRRATPTREFWNLWRDHRAAVDAAGITVGKDGAGQYVCTEWRMVDGAETPLARKIREDAESDAQAALAVPDIEIDERGLLPHQPPAVKRLIAALRKHRAALDASGTGVGKTFQSLSAAIQMGGPVAVICPKAVIPSWERAFAHFGAKPLFVLNYERLRQGRNRWCAPRMDRKGFVWSLPENATLIFDEAHSCKAYPPSRNAWLLMSAARQGVRVLMLSATLATSPIEMWASGRALGLYDHHFDVWLTTMGCRRAEGGKWKYHGGGKGIASLHRRLFPERGNRLRHEDIADFPENLKLVESWDFGDAAAIQKVYDDMNAELAKLQARAERGRGKADELVLMLRARQQTELLKIPAFAEQTKLAVEEGRSVAVFLNFEDSVAALAKRLGTDCIIRGGQSVQQRQARIDSFQHGLDKIIVCNIRAGGVGISLHDTTGGHPRLALICPTFSAADLLQACGRCHRAGGGDVVTKIVFAAGTVEERAMDAVKEKLQRLDQLNDGELTLSAAFVPAEQAAQQEAEKAQLALI